MRCLSCFNKIFKRKSFSLNHELDVNVGEAERLYNPKRIRWMNCIVIPLLIGFALLLVLSNVDFSNESQDITTQFAEVTTDTTTITHHFDTVIVPSTENDVITEGIDTEIQYTGMTQGTAARGAGFSCEDKKSCKTIICTGGPIYTLSYAMEDFDTYCGGVYFDLILENCTFNENTIAKFTMSGRYNMNSLTIRNCELKNIIDNAFKQSTVKKLVNLTFEGNQLQSLNGKSFMGLDAIENFKLMNIQENESALLSVEHFLQPMALSLSTLVLQQSQMGSEAPIIYDPQDWFGSILLFKNLFQVDLSGTIFNNKLNRNSFINLLAVRYLSLANCSLTIIAEYTFDCILTTLESLDLRDNRLQMLDGEFLASATLAGVSIEMAGNQWSCLCENEAIFEFVKRSEGSYSVEPTCASPNDVKGVEIRYMQLKCDDTTPLTVKTSTISITTPIPVSPFSSTTMPSTSTHTIWETVASTEINTTSRTEVTTLDNNETTNITTVSTATTSIENPPLSQPTTEETSAEPETSTSVIDTTDVSKITEATTTIIIPTTTTHASLPPIDQNCFILPLPAIIYCNNSLRSCRYYGHFSVEILSPTSVQLQIGKYSKVLEVIYFESNYNVTYVGQIESSTQETSFEVNQLKSNQSYTFCLIQYIYFKTSPFDCRSAYLPLESSSKWLEYSDKVLFYSIGTFIIVICCIIGIVSIYLVLRWRPTLLCGNTRVRRIASTSHEVLLFAKSDNSLSRSSFSDNLTLHNYSNIKSHDYAQYFRDTELNKGRNVSHISYNQPPLDRAPTPPHEYVDVFNGSGHRREGERVCKVKKRVRHQPKQCTILMQTAPTPNANLWMRQQSAIVDEFENEYEILDYYQQVY